MKTTYRLKLKMKAYVNYVKMFMIGGAFRKMGYDFRLEKTKTLTIPVELLLQSRFYTQHIFQNNTRALMKLPIARARSLSGKNFFSIEEHESVKALKTVLKDNPDPSDLENRLYEYFTSVTIPQNKKIQTLSDLYGMDFSSAALKNWPIWAKPTPWNTKKPDDLQAFLKRKNLSTYVENYYRGEGVNAENGGCQFVFTSPLRAKLEAKLLAQLYHSFTKHGFNE